MSYREQDKRNFSMKDVATSNAKKHELLNKAELLIELRGYQKENLHKDEETINIKASKPNSEETVMMHIVTKSKLKSNSIGVEKAREAEQILEETDIDKIIIFGNRFTKAARRELRENGIEFFSQKQRIASTLNQQELYPQILNCINELCQMICGHIPQSDAECEGYSKEPTTCSICGGSGKLARSPSSYREQRCPVCGGVSSKENHYSCEVRLISDNADFHFERGWIHLLQNDLLSLLKILQATRAEHEEQIAIPLTHGSPIIASVRGR